MDSEKFPSEKTDYEISRLKLMRMIDLPYDADNVEQWSSIPDEMFSAIAADYMLSYDTMERLKRIDPEHAEDDKLSWSDISFGPSSENTLFALISSMYHEDISQPLAILALRLMYFKNGVSFLECARHIRQMYDENILGYFIPMNKKGSTQNIFQLWNIKPTTKLFSSSQYSNEDDGEIEMLEKLGFFDD